MYQCQTDKYNGGHKQYSRQHQKFKDRNLKKESKIRLKKKINNLGLTLAKIKMEKIITQIFWKDKEKECQKSTDFFIILYFVIWCL